MDNRWTTIHVWLFLLVYMAPLLGLAFALRCPDYMFLEDGQCRPCLLCRKVGGGPIQGDIEGKCFPSEDLPDSNDKLHVGGYGPLYCHRGKNPECPLIEEVYPVQNGNWTCEGYQKNWFKTNCFLQCHHGYTLTMATGNVSIETVNMICGIHLNWSGSAAGFDCLPVQETTTATTLKTTILPVMTEPVDTSPANNREIPQDLITTETVTGVIVGTSPAYGDGINIIAAAVGGSVGIVLIVVVMLLVVFCCCQRTYLRSKGSRGSLVISESSSEGPDNKFGITNVDCDPESKEEADNLKQPTTNIINVYSPQNVTIETSGSVEHFNVQTSEKKNFDQCAMNGSAVHSLEDNSKVPLTPNDLGLNLDLSQKGSIKNEEGDLSRWTSFTLENEELSHLETPRKSLPYAEDGDVLPPSWSDVIGERSRVNNTADRAGTTDGANRLGTNYNLQSQMSNESTKSTGSTNQSNNISSSGMDLPKRGGINIKKANKVTANQKTLVSGSMSPEDQTFVTGFEFGGINIEEAEDVEANQELHLVGDQSVTMATGGGQSPGGSGDRQPPIGASLTTDAPSPSMPQCSSTVPKSPETPDGPYFGVAFPACQVEAGSSLWLAVVNTCPSQGQDGGQEVYSWFHQSSATALVNSQSYRIDDASPKDSGIYCWMVLLKDGTFYSGTLKVEVTDGPESGEISLNTADVGMQPLTANGGQSRFIEGASACSVRDTLSRLTYDVLQLLTNQYPLHVPVKPVNGHISGQSGRHKYHSGQDDQSRGQANSNDKDDQGYRQKGFGGTHLKNGGMFNEVFNKDILSVGTQTEGLIPKWIPHCNDQPGHSEQCFLQLRDRSLPSGLSLDLSLGQRSSSDQFTLDSGYVKLAVEDGDRSTMETNFSSACPPSLVSLSTSDESSFESSADSVYSTGSYGSSCLGNGHHGSISSHDSGTQTDFHDSFSQQGETARKQLINSSNGCEEESSVNIDSHSGDVFCIVAQPVEADVVELRDLHRSEDLSNCCMNLSELMENQEFIDDFCVLMDPERKWEEMAAILFNMPSHILKYIDFRTRYSGYCTEVALEKAVTENSTLKVCQLVLWLAHRGHHRANQVILHYHGNCNICARIVAASDKMEMSV